jgi:hypothetical protein
MLDFFFEPENGGDMILRNVLFSQNCIALQFRRKYSSYIL